MNARSPEIVPEDRGASASIDMVAEPGERGVSLLRVVHRHLRGRYVWALLLALACGAACGLAGWKSQVPLYRAEGLIYIEPSLPSILDPQGNNVLPMFKGFVALQVLSLGSPRMTQLAMEKDAWQRTGKGREPEAIQEFTERRSILHEPETQHIRVHFVDERPEVALAGVDALMRAYQDWSNDQNTSDLALHNAKTQADRLAASCTEGAGDLLKLAAPFGGEEALKLRHVDSVNQQLAAEAELKKTVAAIASHTTEDPDAAAPAPKSEEDLAFEHDLLAETRLQLAVLVLKEAELKQDAGERNSELVALRREIQVKRKWIDEFVAGRNRQIREEWERRRRGTKSHQARLEELRAQEAALKEQVRSLQEENERLVRIGVQIGRLKTTLAEQNRKLELASAAQEYYAAQLVGTGRIKITEWGTLPTMPYRDRRVALAVAGGVLGGTLGVLVVLLLGLRRRQIRYTDDIGTSLSRLKLLGLMPALPEDLADPQGREVAAHCVHQIRTLLQIGQPRDGGRCFCITGPGVGSGKTTLSLALGLSFARSGTRTLLIDADLTGRGLTRRVGQMLLSHVRNVAGQVDGWKGQAPAAADGAGPASQLLAPLVSRRRVEDPPEADEMLDLLSRSLERLGLEGSRGPGQVADLFALADLRFPPEVRAQLASHLTSLLPPNGAITDQAASVGIPPPVRELEPAHPEFNGVALERYLYPTGTDTLRFLPLRGLGAGGGVSVATIAKVLDRVRNEFDVVLVDTGPVLGALETPIVGAHADAVVFVVSPGDHRPDAERAVARLEEVGARIAGVVFNRAHPEDILRSGGSKSSLVSRGEPR